MTLRIFPLFCGVSLGLACSREVPLSRIDRTAPPKAQVGVAYRVSPTGRFALTPPPEKPYAFSACKEDPYAAYQVRSDGELAFVPTREGPQKICVAASNGLGHVDQYEFDVDVEAAVGSRPSDWNDYRSRVAAAWSAIDPKAAIPKTCPDDVASSSPRGTPLWDVDALRDRPGKPLYRLHTGTSNLPAVPDDRLALLLEKQEYVEPHVGLDVPPPPGAPLGTEGFLPGKVKGRLVVVDLEAKAARCAGAVSFRNAKDIKVRLLDTPGVSQVGPIREQLLEDLRAAGWTAAGEALKPLARGVRLGSI